MTNDPPSTGEVGRPRDEQRMISNGDLLVTRGIPDVRRPLIEIVETALRRVQPDQLVPRAIGIEDDRYLSIEGTIYDLQAVEEVSVIGAGKGSLEVVRALRTVLGDHLSGGIVVEKHGQGGELEGIEVLETGHPIPDEDSLDAGDRVRAVAEAAGPDDLVIACISGGTSAQVVSPAGDLSLDDLAESTRQLLFAGLPIDEVNAVRRQLSDLKGGQLAKLVEPARLVTLVIADEPRAEPWGPTVTAETTATDAVGVLRRRGLWEAVPASVRAHLRCREAEALETPSTELDRQRGQIVVLASATDVCEAALDAARDQGYEASILSTSIEGESREVARVFGSFVAEISRHGRPLEPPCAFITGGELTVSVGAETGTGGPNQEFALQLGREIEEHPTAGAIAIDTDGTDGPTDKAGGIVDGATADRAARVDVDLDDHLRRHDSTTALERLEDVVETGALGTNVMDLRVVLIES